MSGYHSAVMSTFIMFPAYEEVDVADPFREPHLLVNLPWFNCLHWWNIGVVSQYANDEVITGRVPLGALPFSEWDLHCIVPTRDIICSPGKSFPSFHVELVGSFQKRLRRIYEEYPVPLDSHLDT